jgi:predicted transcriptional regulator
MTLRKNIPVLRTVRNLLGEYEFFGNRVKKNNPQYARTAQYLINKIENEIAPVLIPPELGNSLKDKEMREFIEGYNYEVHEHSDFLSSGATGAKNWSFVPMSSSPQNGIDLSEYVRNVAWNLWIRKKIFGENDFEENHFFRQLGYEEVNTGNKSAVSNAFHRLEEEDIIEWNGDEWSNVEFTSSINESQIRKEPSLNLDKKEREVLRFIFKEVENSSKEYLQTKQKDLAKKCGISPGGQGISKILSSLQNKGWIAIQKNKRPYKYYISPVKEEVSKGLMNEIERELFTSFVILKEKDKNPDEKFLAQLHDIEEESAEEAVSKFKDLGVDKSEICDPEFNLIKEDQIEIDSNTLSELL